MKGYLIGCGLGVVLVTLLGEMDFSSMTIALLLLILIGVVYIVHKVEKL